MIKEKLSDKYSVDELSEKIFPWACLAAGIIAVIYIIMCIADPWNIIFVPLVVLGLFIAGCIFLMIACGISIGVAKLIYFFEGAEE